MVLVNIGEHGIIFCEHEHFDFLSFTSSEHFEKTFGEHRAKKIFGKQRANKKQFVNEKVRLVDEVIEN